VIERMRLMHSDKLSYDVEDLDLKFLSASHPTPTAARAATAGGQPFEREPGKPASAAAGGETSARPRRTPEEGPMPDAVVEVFLRNGGSRVRRYERLQKLFAQHRKLTRGEIVRILGISPNTATKYLKELCAEGFVERIAPSASTRSHYFVLRQPPDTRTEAPSAAE
jgi:hypothetical protein